MNDLHLDGQEKVPIASVGAAPREPDKSGEKSKWVALLKFLKEHGQKIVEVGSLGTARGRARWDAKTSVINAEAKVKKKEVEIKAAEAAAYAAKTDHQRQETVKVVNQEIERVLESDASEVTKMMQLANLMAANPQIAEQLGRIKEMYEFLHSARGFRMEIEARPELVEAEEESAIEEGGEVEGEE